MWHVPFLYSFHLAWCPQVPSMLLAAAEFPSFHGGMFHRFSYTRWCPFLVGIEVLAQHLWASWVLITSSCQSLVWVPRHQRQLHSIYWHFKLTCPFQPELYQSDWLTVCENSFLLLQAIAFFSFILTTSPRSSIGVFMPPAFLKICAKVRVTMGLSLLNTLGNVTEQLGRPRDLIVICHLQPLLCPPATHLECSTQPCTTGSHI